MVFKKQWKNPSGSRAYYAWRSMRSRCLNPMNASYKHYGARGISVCEEWVNDFDKFFDDMGEAPEGMSLDRIDNELGYSPQNCRWATLRDQLNNQRRNRRLTLEGVTMTASQWAEKLGIRLDTLLKRLDRMPVDQALKSGSIKSAWSHGTRHAYEKHKCRCDQCKQAHNQRMREMRAKRADRLQGLEH